MNTWDRFENMPQDHNNYFYVVPCFCDGRVEHEHFDRARKYEKVSDEQQAIEVRDTRFVEQPIDLRVFDAQS